MKGDWQELAFRSALRMIENGPPKDLISRAQPEALDRGESLSAPDLTEILKTAAETDPFLNAFGMQVHKWDAADTSAEWIEETKPSTPERRTLICKKLGLDEAGGVVLLERRPIFHDETIVITAPWNRWYTAERAADHAFYWPRYRDFLLNVRKWPEDNVTSLDLASNDVVERLTDPTRKQAYQSKGLVVGYVQSGKTANFTGVVAKAIDAGYRLIIVMTGTIEMLRSQTQRRIDMEMVGRQNILGDYSHEQAIEAKVDYQDDEDWLAGRFLDLGQGELVTEIRRLTHHRKDYQKQFKTLKIDRFQMSRPLYDPLNLFSTGARLVVVKKNARVLGKLVSDIKANTKAFAEIPVLIIDDESDQASVNTIDPEVVIEAKKEGKEVKERRAINEAIANMLELMPRSQYVGYTATPFANVFVDPSDPQGIFPSDFVIALRRPPRYMGVDDFHDLEELTDGEKTVANSHKKAFVRMLKAADHESDLQDKELAEAIDMFVLTGAVKLYRATVDPTLDFRHHTMLVHNSVRTKVQRDLAETVQELWVGREFTKPAARVRLNELYVTDLVPVSKVRAESGAPPLPEFAVLADYVAQAVGRITEHSHNPVIVVNSDKEIQERQQDLDFDRQSTWRILVGGAKLSRGFTIEGLTISYFRRATNMRDSLTQMGRWFGFRDGYRDLVRLYIAEKARFGGKTIDLYEAFESIALDEAAFRAQLEMYAEWDGDRPKVLPREIPPLVSQHLPWLRPTARNKMFNAVLVEQSEQPFTSSGYANRLDLLKENLEIWRPVFAAAKAAATLPQGGGGDYEAFIGVVEAEKIVEAIEASHYLHLYHERSIKPKSKFYRRLITEGMLEDFLIVVPQPDSGKANIAGIGERAIISRDRRAGRRGLFGEITEPKHRHSVNQFVTSGAPPVPGLANWAGPKRGAVLLYLAKESKPDYEPLPSSAFKKTDPEAGLVAAFSAYVPSEALARDPAVIQFQVRDESKRDAPTIHAPDNGTPN